MAYRSNLKSSLISLLKVTHLNLNYLVLSNLTKPNPKRICGSNKMNFGLDAIRRIKISFFYNDAHL